MLRPICGARAEKKTSGLCTITHLSRSLIATGQILFQVFLLAPNLGSWEQMQLDSPSPTCRARAVDCPPGSRSGPTTTTPRLTPPISGASAFQSQRGFPPDPPGAVTDNRGFPILNGDSMSHRSDSIPRPATSSPSRQTRGNDGSGGGRGAHRGMPNHSNTGQMSEPSSPSPGLPREHRNLFLSPFSSTLPAETATPAATSKFDGNRTSWVGRAGKGGGGGGEDSTGPESPPPPSPSRQAKGSHAKLDLVLHEIQRVNGRLDMIVGRLGVLEEEHAKLAGLGRA